MSELLGTWNSPDPRIWQAMLVDLTQPWQPDRLGDWQSPDLELRLGRIQGFNTPESALESPVVEAEGCVLVWDGRLDDREPLLAGRASVTDAQLLLEAYRRWGVDCLSHLIGDYRFILWDRVQQQLVAGSDSMGNRPLAYHWNGDTLLISSRVLPLLRHPQVSRRLDPLYLTHTLCDRWSHPPGLTAFVDIQRLRPGWALILNHQQLTVKPVAPLTAVESDYRHTRQPDAEDQFWYLLHQAIRDRRRSYRPVCTTLSGGLDSTTVTLGLLQQTGEIDAFSNITTIYQHFDERQPIQTFLDAFPPVHWHSVNSDLAWPFGADWADLPLPDDPLVACTMPMNGQMLRQMKRLGFGTSFGGDWGDELFDGNFYDLLTVGAMGQSFGQISQQRHWPAFLWHNWVLPSLATPVQHWWCRRKLRERRPRLLPPWLTPDYRQQPELETALYQTQTQSLNRSRKSWIAGLQENSGMVGSQQAYRLLQTACQVDVVSPLADKRLFEFACQLHPTLQNHPEYNKIFLRRAIQSVMPRTITWRHKTNHFSPLMYAGLALGESLDQLCHGIQDDPDLAAIFDAVTLEQNLTEFRSKYTECNFSTPDLPFHWASQLYASLIFIDWIKRLKTGSRPAILASNSIARFNGILQS